MPGLGRGCLWGLTVSQPQGLSCSCAPFPGPQFCFHGLFPTQTPRTFHFCPRSFQRPETGSEGQGGVSEVCLISPSGHGNGHENTQVEKEWGKGILPWRWQSDFTWARCTLDKHKQQVHSGLRVSRSSCKSLGVCGSVSPLSPFSRLVEACLRPNTNATPSRVYWRGEGGSVRLCWAGCVLTLFSFPAVIPSSPPRTPSRPPPPNQPPWLGLRAGMSLGCCMFCFLFYFANASQHSPLCLMSPCQVHAVARQQEGSPCVIHPLLPINLLHASPWGKGSSWPSGRQRGGLLPGRGRGPEES